MSDMNNILTKLFMVIMLMIFSMGAQADVKVLFGEDGKELQSGKDGTITLPQKEVTGGTVVITQEDQKDGTFKVFLSVAPDKGYTFEEKNLEVYAVISPDVASTRAPEISGAPLKLTEEKIDVSSAKRYSVKIDSNLALWVKKAKFESDKKNRNVIWPDGVYYIYNNASYTNTNYPAPWYLWPSVVSNSATGQKYVTTLHSKEAPAVEGIYEKQESKMCHWVVKNLDNGNIQIISPMLDKYIVIRNQEFGNSTLGRDVWLDDFPTDDESKAQFQLTSKTGDYYRISPTKIYVGSGTASDYTFNSANEDQDGLGSGKNNNAGGKALKDDRPGLIQFSSSGTPRWTVEQDLLAAPTISDVDESTNTFTITDANSLPAGYTIRYTVGDGTQDEPTATTGTEYLDPVEVMSNWTVKAVVVRYGIVLTNVATKVVSPVLGKPVISFNNTTNKVSISCVVSTADIYYNTGDGTQDDPDTSTGTLYETPFEVTSPTSIKAISSLDGEVSPVAKLEIDQVAKPTIQENGSNAISITSATAGATIYYTTDGNDPTTSSTEYTEPLTENVSNVTIKAIAVKEGMITSAVESGSVKLQCATPVITRVGLSFSLSCSMPTDATFYYSLDASTPAILYNGPVSFTKDQLPMTVTAVARHNDYTDSESATFVLKTGEGTSDNPYLIYSDTDFANFINDVKEGSTSSACYKLEIDVSASGVDDITTAFTGTFDGGLHIISDLGHALFNTINGGIVKNVILDNVGISNGTNVGAIVNEAEGSTRIYNCGILSGSVGGSKKVGGLVGLLDGEARVINCFSYADITSGEDKGGIVGYNNVASTQSSLTTMVMNCMFYGDIAEGNNISPIYGGEEINNVDGGLNTYNYYRFESPFSKNGKVNKYNRALAMPEKFINRFERYRLLLNSNKKLAAKYASTSTNTVAPEDMAKWVLETADRTISNPYPYPVLKTQGKYPSIINIDAENAPNSASVGRNHGGKLGKTLSVKISGVGTGAPTGASLINNQGANVSELTLTLTRTDKDADRFNYNYDKVQLPYYNDYGTKNYTKNKVVTGWKITSFTGGTPGAYSEADEWGGYNFADRNCTNKDLYGAGGSYRVFSQGAYFDVPNGVTGITIEPYWGQAAYVSDQTYDVIYDNGYANKGFTPFGNQYTNGAQIDFHGDGNKQKVYTSIANASASMTFADGETVYDHAVVLVGNVHQNGNPTKTDTPYTVMSIDMNHDNEPDYSYIFGHKDRQWISPIRYDFLNIMGIAEAQMPKGATTFRNVSIVNPKGWYEITNTCIVNFVQFEYDNSGRGAETKTPSPLIFLGGTFEQFVSTKEYTLTNGTKYIHVGGNVWFAKFGNGTHSDGNKFTPHIPISVTGGDYDEFYLSGTYQPKITNMQADNAECYVSGGHFGEMAAGSLEQIKGDVRWDINWADITNFYGGGTNANNPITGNITVDIANSHVNLYCGGPKFGDMDSGKTVVTNATDCNFGTYFGAGYGGNSYNRVKYYDNSNLNPYDKQGDYKNDRGKYFDGATTNAPQNANFGKKGKGVATDFDYEFFVWSSGVTGGRFYVKFVSFSLATTNDVTSNLERCTITKDFYGGGSLGKVAGDATSVLNNCNVTGNVYGAGFSATLPKIDVRKNPAFSEKPSVNTNIGMFEMGEINGTEKYEWKQVASMPANGDPGMISNSEGNFVYTDQDLTALGTVTGDVHLTLNNTTVGESVYGGGEQSAVNGDTEVIVTGGTIGELPEGVTTFGATYGNVYGGGKGKAENEEGETFDDLTLVKMGIVKGNTNVTINSGAIKHNVYGGGAFGSVGNFTFADAAYNTANPTATLPLGTIVGYTGGGTANVTITGGTIGTTGKDNGMVFGSSRGDVDAPGSIQDRLAWVHDTHVIIGTSGQGTTLSTPLIKGSVYGSGENGHTYQNTIVDVYGGTIGITEGATITTNNNGTPDDDSDDTKYSGAEYPYRGNVYGGGCGTDTYTEGDVEKFNPLAGIVQGNATVNIDGGQVVHNVYGAGAMGSVGTVTDANSGKTTINISGGRIGYDGDGNGHVFGAARGEFGICTAASGLANVRETEVNISYTTTPTADNEGKTEQLIAGSVFGGGEAGTVKGSVAVNMTGGLIMNDVYGGGALADTQTSNWDSNAGGWAEGKSSASTTTTVSLKGGTIRGEAYGGGLGEAGKPAYVWGDVLVDLNNNNNGETADGAKKGCAVGQVFGCNNVNGTPKGSVTVHVYATQHQGKSQIGNTSGETPVTDAKVKDSYDVLAVYGGGNLAAYEPVDAFSSDETKKANAQTNVIIDGCGLTSIQTVYGGGNAASTPATEVTVNGTFEIEELFGGGNGKDDLPNGDPNPGANVGFKDYSAVESNYDTKEKRQTSEFINTYVYGSGKASLNVYGGTIHRVFGGSNTKGNVRQTAVTLLDENSGCDFCVDEAYGGGKSAPMDAEAKLLMACIPGLNAAYGGAEAADIQGNVTLTITNGRFHRVFGGNNLSGTIRGAIKVNVEEVGCKPIIIGELYGGGNQAGYSVFGYKQKTEGGKLVWKPRESATDNTADGECDNLTTPYADPQVNVKSFTSIGAVYGGGYGSTAVMVGNPTVNVSVVEGAWKDYAGEPTRYDETGYEYNASGYKGETLTIVDTDGTTTHNVELPNHAKGKIGAIGQVFGGGNAAKVIGNTDVNIGTLAKVVIKSYVESVSVGASVEGLYTRSGEGTVANPYRYTAATGTAVEGTTYYEEKNVEKDVVGVDIRGNVYGGGNEAEVTGNTNVFIGKKAE